MEFVQTMRVATDIGRLTTVMSLYQASETIYELFDKVRHISDKLNNLMRMLRSV